MQRNNPTLDNQNIPIQFYKSADIDVASAICRVSAMDMDTMTTILAVSATEISGTMSGVPYGEDRLFEIMCYNSSREMNYYGSALVDINSVAPAVNIVLYPFSSEANVSISGTFGDVEDTEEKITFVADWNGNYNVYIMNTDGSNVRQISFSPYNANCPIISPDRKKVVYQRPSEVGHQGFIIDLNTLQEQMIPLEEYYPHQFYWHPSEDKLLFWSTIHGTADLFEYDMSMNTVKCLIEDRSRIWGNVYTPDGNKILYHSDKTGTFRVYIADRDGSNQSILCSRDSVEERTLRIHPSNNDLFVFSARGYTESSLSQWGIFLFDRSTDVVRNIISTLGVDESRPQWSPQGDKILYSRYDGVSRSLYVINPDGSENKLLLDHVGNEMYPHWR